MGRRLALVVGNSTYNDPDLEPLPHALNDVDAVEAVLKATERCCFASVTKLKNPGLTEFRQAFELLLEQARPDDTVLFYYSGHGVVDADRDFYFANYETKHLEETRKLLRESAVKASVFHDHIAKSRARRLVIVLDCCFSGAFPKGMTHKSNLDLRTSFFGSNASGSRLALDGDDEMGGTGRVILASSRATQFSFTQANQELSAYTNCFVTGLSSGAPVKPGKSRISVKDLHDYIATYFRNSNLPMEPQYFPFRDGGSINLSHAVTLRRTPSGTTLGRVPTPVPSRAGVGIFDRVPPPVPSRSIAGTVDAGSVGRPAARVPTPTTPRSASISTSTSSPAAQRGTRPPPTPRPVEAGQTYQHHSYAHSPHGVAINAQTVHDTPSRPNVRPQRPAARGATKPKSVPPRSSPAGTGNRILILSATAVCVLATVYFATTKDAESDGAREPTNMRASHAKPAQPPAISPDEDGEWWCLCHQEAGFDNTTCRREEHQCNELAQALADAHRPGECIPVDGAFPWESIGETEQWVESQKSGATQVQGQCVLPRFGPGWRPGPWAIRLSADSDFLEAKEHLQTAEQQLGNYRPVLLHTRRTSRSASKQFFIVVGGFTSKREAERKRTELKRVLGQGSWLHPIATWCPRPTWKPLGYYDCGVM